MGPRPRAGLERALEDAVEHRARHAARERIGVGVLGLTRAFGLADHLGIQARDDREQMLDGLQAGDRAKVPVEFGGRDAGRLDQRRARMQGDGFIADRIGFEPVARREQDHLREAGRAGRAIEGLHPRRRNAERRARIETGRVVGGA